MTTAQLVAAIGGLIATLLGGLGADRERSYR
jgi:hypothetical protein